MRLGSTALSVTRPGSNRRPVAVPTATYALSSNGSVNEGESMVVTVTTTNVTDGTVLYWSTSNITTSDSDFTATSGTTTITSNSGSFSVATVADSTTEGAETFGITLRVGSQSGTIVTSTTNKTINDTSQTPSYSASSASSINEGSALGVTVTTTNVSDGTTLYWTNSHTTTNAADFSSNSGSFTITSNSGTFNVPVVADSTTEGAETFTVEIRTGSTSGTIVATLPSVTVNDTSIAASYSFSSASSVDEGASLACTVTTTSVADSTTLYWTINHTTTSAADFTSTSGSFTVTSNSGTFNIATATDSLTEGAEYFTVEIRTGSTSGTIVETSSSITVNDAVAWNDISTATYARSRPSGSNPTSMYWKPDGTRVFIGFLNLLVSYDLSTPWLLTTISGSTTGTLSLNAVAGNTNLSPTGLYFKDNGTSVFYTDFYSDKVLEHVLPTAWDLNSASSTVTRSFQITGETALRGVYISPDGTKMFVNGFNTDLIRRYDLSTAWDITTASATHNSLAVGSTPLGLFFKSDGTKVFVTDNAGDRIYQLTLTTPWDVNGISRSTHQTSTLSMAFIESVPIATYISPDGAHLYNIGQNLDRIYEFIL
jgi:hypothetical protein